MMAGHSLLYRGVQVGMFLTRLLLLYCRSVQQNLAPWVAISLCSISWQASYQLSLIREESGVIPYIAYPELVHVDYIYII